MKNNEKLRVRDWINVNGKVFAEVVHTWSDGSVDIAINPDADYMRREVLRMDCCGIDLVLAIVD